MSEENKGMISIRLANGRELESQHGEEIANFLDSNGTSIDGHKTKRKTKRSKSRPNGQPFRKKLKK